MHTLLALVDVLTGTARIPGELEAAGRASEGDQVRGGFRDSPRHHALTKVHSTSKQSGRYDDCISESAARRPSRANSCHVDGEASH